MKTTTNPLQNSMHAAPFDPDSVVHLVKKAKDGDEKSFTALYELFYPIVHRRIWNLVPAADVDDVTQEVFLAAIRSLKNFRGESKFSTWLHTLTTRQVANYYRKNGSRLAQVDDEFDEYAEILPEQRTDSAPKDIDEVLTIRNGLIKIQPDYQEIIFLRLINGYKFKEIAEIMQKSQDAVKSHFRRALKALQQEIDDNYDKPEF